MIKASSIAMAAAVAAALLSPVEAGAFELLEGASPASHLGEGMIQTVQHRITHGNVNNVHVNRNVNVNRNFHTYRPVAGVPGYRPPIAGVPGYRPPIGGVPGYRPPVVVGPGVAWVGRPGWYGWAPGGAIAYGAAIGFVVAATAVAWAGPPPAPGLCWYYTDPSRTRGFWDACPY